MALTIGRSGYGRRIGALLLAACGTTACGAGDDRDPGDEPETEPLPVPTRVTPTVTSPSEPASVLDIRSLGDGTAPSRPAGGDPNCTRPGDVSGAPRSITDAILLMNSLPKPTTLPCFIESLDRPLALYMTSSNQSLQPSPGERSPRTFIISGPLVLSIVPDGSEVGNTLELGFETSRGRTIKTEILFPLEKNVLPGKIFDRIRRGSTTVCGNCHSGEIHADHELFPEGVFESNVVVPNSLFEVRLDSLHAEAVSCDDGLEKGRCDLLTALFDHGEVRQANIWAEEADPY